MRSRRLRPGRCRAPTSERYLDAYLRLTGRALSFPAMTSRRGMLFIGRIAAALGRSRLAWRYATVPLWIAA